VGALVTDLETLKKLPIPFVDHATVLQELRGRKNRA
jgi:hypothetical protein